MKSRKITRGEIEALRARRIATERRAAELARLLRQLDGGRPQRPRRRMWPSFVQGQNRVRAISRSPNRSQALSLNRSRDAPISQSPIRSQDPNVRATSIDQGRIRSPSSNNAGPITNAGNLDEAKRAFDQALKSFDDFSKLANFHSEEVNIRRQRYCRLIQDVPILIQAIGGLAILSILSSSEKSWLAHIDTLFTENQKENEQIALKHDVTYKFIDELSLDLSQNATSDDNSMIMLRVQERIAGIQEPSNAANTKVDIKHVNAMKCGLASRALLYKKLYSYVNGESFQGNNLTALIPEKNTIIERLKREDYATFINNSIYVYDTFVHPRRIRRNAHVPTLKALLRDRNTLVKHLEKDETNWIAPMVRDQLARDLKWTENDKSANGVTLRGIERTLEYVSNLGKNKRCRTSDFRYILPTDNVLKVLTTRLYTKKTENAKPKNANSNADAQTWFFGRLVQRVKRVFRW